jgi:hypothetical protein
MVRVLAPCYWMKDDSTMGNMLLGVNGICKSRIGGRCMQALCDVSELTLEFPNRPCDAHFHNRVSAGFIFLLNASG